MNSKKVLKIISFIIGPLIPLIIAVYFLFPYLNKEKYNEVAEKYHPEVEVESEFTDTLAGESTEEQIKTFQDENSPLQRVVDSLRMANDSLEAELLNKKKELERLTSGIIDKQDEKETEVRDKSLYEKKEEEFKETIKSFLSLDDENLAPIINEMSDDQLVRLYRGGSSLHRKKLLRTLESKRAAKLITEVM